MRISTIIISLLILGGLFIGFYSFATSLSGEDGFDVPIDTTYSSTFDKTSELSDNINTNYNDMMNWSTKKNSATQIITLVPDALSLVKNIIVLPFSLISTVMTDFMSLLGLPGWFTSFLLSVIAIVLIFAFMALILRYRDT